MARRRKKVAVARKARRSGKVGRPTGFKCSPATRRKMSLSAKRRWRGHKSSKAVARKTVGVRHRRRRRA
jgi:hypothetical protein